MKGWNGLEAPPTTLNRKKSSGSDGSVSYNSEYDYFLYANRTKRYTKSLKSSNLKRMESDGEEIDVVGLDEDGGFFVFQIFFLDIHPTNNILMMENFDAIQNIGAHEAGVENLLYQPMRHVHPEFFDLPEAGGEPIQARVVRRRRVVNNPPMHQDEIFDFPEAEGEPIQAPVMISAHGANDQLMYQAHLEMFNLPTGDGPEPIQAPEMLQRLAVNDQPMHHAHTVIFNHSANVAEPIQLPVILPRRVAKPKVKSSAKKHKNAKPKSGTSQKIRKQQNGYQEDCKEADNESGSIGNRAAGKKNIARKHGTFKKDDNEPAKNRAAKKKTPYKKRHYKKRNTSPQPKYKVKVDRTMAGASGPLRNPKRNCRAQCNRCGIDLNNESWCKLCGMNPYTDESGAE